MPGDGTVLLGMPDIKLLDRLKITCKVMRGPHEGGKFDFPTMQTSKNPNCKANRTQQIKADNVYINFSPASAKKQKKGKSCINEQNTMDFVIFSRNWMF